MNQSASALIIEDDTVFNDLMVRHLKRMGLTASGATNWVEATAFLDENEPDIVLLDQKLPDAEGMRLLKELVPVYPVIMLTAFGSVELAVEAIRAGASEYLQKPVNLEELEVTVQRVLERSYMQRDMHFYKSRTRRINRPFMVGRSPLFQEVIKVVDAVAPSDTTVLIQGESGVGKELVAREIHEHSLRSGRNFVPLDCCTLHESLFESELFGHERGAFTGADRQKKGLIETADGGTLFLDEIGEISPPIQAKLLRVLETGEFRRLGGTKDLRANVRIIVATNRNLEQMAKAGSFREDLYYRICAFVIDVPPLRKRIEDISDLVKKFLSHHNFSRPVDKILAPEAHLELKNYDWPGNVRELRNVIERAIILSADGDTIYPEHLGLKKRPSQFEDPSGFTISDRPTLEDLKTRYVQLILEETDGHRQLAASILGISERNIYRLLKRHKLEV